MDNQHVPITTVKDSLSDFVRQAETGQSLTTITVNSRPTAMIVPATADYDPRPVTSVGGGWTYVGRVNSYPPYPFTPPGFIEEHSGHGDPVAQLRKLIDGPRGENRDGLKRLLDRWVISEDRGREGAHLWRHLLSDAAILAVPYATYTNPGGFTFFHTTGPGQPVLHLDEWGRLGGHWDAGDHNGHATAHRRTVAAGSKALGIGGDQA